MQIILMCQHESGQVAFHAKFIDGIPAPERRYDIRNHQVILDNGLAEAILHHDAEELLRNPIYRLPTPAEQEAWTGLHQATNVPANVIQESAVSTFVVTGTNQHGQPVSETITVPSGVSVTSQNEYESIGPVPAAPPAVENQPAKRKYTRKK